MTFDLRSYKSSNQVQIKTLLTECAVCPVCELNSYLTLCSRQLFVPGELLQLVTQDIYKFQLIKQSSALPHPDSEPVALFDVCLW